MCCSILGQSADIASWTRDLTDLEGNPGALVLGEPEVLEGVVHYPVLGVNAGAVMEAVARMMLELAAALQAAVAAGDFGPVT